ncbi:TetR/AcrR family transcriptional regulator [Streptomyces cyaneus]|uniref:TetR/AcrR family transcriptional regulator n=1 Tax=Streptomyces cyaneus TaxID=1904 RepID=UPI000FF8B486|nr:TetR/AcrR family transcriptional regulator [Streptomyces cyaneus]
MSPMTSAHSSPLTDRPQLGLRERKKIKTRTAIRDATYALIKEQGYDATTIEQIAERAEVSPSTVFRYFPTKEDIVLTDEYDPILLEELRKRPADEPWMESLRYVMRLAISAGLAEGPEVVRLRSHLLVQVPAVRSRMLESMSVTGRMLAEAVAERNGLDRDSLEARVYTMSLIGGLAEISLYWAENDFKDDLHDLLDRTLDVIEHGLPGKNA